MAHVKLLERASTAIRLMYLVDGVVGRGGNNRRDDVLLVQFFLNALWGTKPDKLETIGSGAAPRIDGDCGPETINAITVFQKWYWQGPDHGFADGRIEPLPAKSVYGPLKKLPYSILGLNVNFGLEFGIDRHSLISKETNFPIELKPRLFVAN